MTQGQPSTSVTPENLAAAGWKQHALRGHMGQVGPLWSQPLATGGWRYGLLMQAQHLNPAGVVHGGVLLTLADHAMSAVAWQHCQRQACVTVQLDSHFVASGKEGDWVECAVQISHSTRSMVFARATLHAQGQLLLSAQGILKVLASKDNAAHD